MKPSKHDRLYLILIMILTISCLGVYFIFSDKKTDQPLIINQKTKITRQHHEEDDTEKINAINELLNQLNTNPQLDQIPNIQTQIDILRDSPEKQELQQRLLDIKDLIEKTETQNANQSDYEFVLVYPDDTETDTTEFFISETPLETSDSDKAETTTHSSPEVTDDNSNSSFEDTFSDLTN